MSHYYGDKIKEDETAGYGARIGDMKIHTKFGRNSRKE
jgi:hypothetical protein